MYCCCWTVCPLQQCTARVLSKFTSLDWNRLCSTWHTCVRTRRHRSWLSQRDDNLGVRLLWLPRRINRLEARVDTRKHSSRRQRSTKICYFCAAVCCAPTAVVPGTAVLSLRSYYCRFDGTHAHTQTHAETVHSCHKREMLPSRLLLYRGCVKVYSFCGLVWDL